MGHLGHTHWKAANERCAASSTCLFILFKHHTHTPPRRRLHSIHNDDNALSPVWSNPNLRGLINQQARGEGLAPHPPCHPRRMAWLPWKDSSSLHRMGYFWYISKPTFPTQGPLLAMCLIDEKLSRCLFWNDCRLLWAAICLSSPLVSAVDDYEALVDPNTGLPMTSRCDV